MDRNTGVNILVASMRGWTVGLLVVSLVLVVASFVAGCGEQGPPRVIVEGQVSYDGAPVANGEIRFIPVKGTQGPVSGGPIKDGRYVAKAKGGVPLGTHRVDIRGFRPAARQAGTAEDVAVEGGPAEQYLPLKYNVESELQVDIDGRGRVTQDFDLDK